MNLRSDRKLELSLTFSQYANFVLKPDACSVCPTKKLVGMNNKETYIRAYIRTYTRVYTRVCARIDIREYAKYARIIRVCDVRLYLSCTVHACTCMYMYVVDSMTGMVRSKIQIIQIGSEREAMS